jgi:hypothetical protein
MSFVLFYYGELSFLEKWPARFKMYFLILAYSKVKSLDFTVGFTLIVNFSVLKLWLVLFLH